LSDPEFLRAYVAGDPGGDGGALSVQEEALYVDGWWPAAVRLGPQTHLVRTDLDGPEQDLTQVLMEALESAGLRPIQGDWSVVEAVTFQRLGLVGATWQVLGTSEAQARLDIEAAATGQTVPLGGRTLEDVTNHQLITQRGADRLRKGVGGR